MCLFCSKDKFQYNSTCCCKETPSTTGWNHKSLYFYPHYTGISKVVFPSVRTHFLQAYVIWNARIYCKPASVCCANWIALSVEGIYCMTDLFLKTTFEWSAGKNNHDFAQPLMFRYSHIWCLLFFLQRMTFSYLNASKWYNIFR